ncbi:Zn-ribbon domain-containing OB-fold protein [Alicycliphilus denitrificans]|uniref:Zn-ribbon domain-containing OB-fold protein n=1 Tax=Alicycliphilus denitrificans TaxID=179636 RepID=A0A420KH56_9BURK|nr:Zn-ribbon domain-containing OB-fold protein [Alicycliphilus denitrificans]RKJ99261.1 Zn-ribbon domain-containing OB-fold protein [Alicycliphilus denitrificans]
MSEAPARPLPQPTDLTRPYWQAAARGELHMQHCGACGRWQFYPRPFCIHCEADALQWRAVSGLGRIYTYTVNHRAPNAFMKARLPYVVAIVELDEGPRLMANVLGNAVDQAGIGKRVKVTFEAVSEEVALPQFVLLE